MNRNKPILSLTSIVLVFFLFVPIVTKSFNTPSNHLKTIGFTKSSSVPTKADSQMPFEEKEKEEGADHSLIQLPLIYIISEYVSFTIEKSPGYPDDQVSGFFGNTPLYIVKRSILI